MLKQQGVAMLTGQGAIQDVQRISLEVLKLVKEHHDLVTEVGQGSLARSSGGKA